MSGWLVDLLILLGVLAIVSIAAWYVFSMITLPEPIKKMLLVVLVIVAAIIAILILLQARGGIKLSKYSSSEIGAMIPAPLSIIKAE